MVRMFLVTANVGSVFENVGAEIGYNISNFLKISQSSELRF